MRDHLDEVAERQALQHRAAQRDFPAVLEHAHLAPVLGLVRGRRLLERARLGLVDRPPARLHHPVGQGEVVAPLRVDLDVVGAADCVDRAVPAGDRAEPRLGLPLDELVAPVDAFSVGSLLAVDHAGRRRRRPRGRRSSPLVAGARRAPRSRWRPRRRRSRRSSRARHGSAQPPCRRGGSRSGAPVRHRRWKRCARRARPRLHQSRDSHRCRKLPSPPKTASLSSGARAENPSHSAPRSRPLHVGPNGGQISPVVRLG